MGEIELIAGVLYMSLPLTTRTMTCHTNGSLVDVAPGTHED